VKNSIRSSLKPPKPPQNLVDLEVGGENLQEIIQKDKDSNTVFIGQKEPMTYVMAVVTQYNTGNNSVVIKARGKAISKAVDVAEIVRHRFITDLSVSDIKIDTEEVQREEGKMKVSSMEITLTKQ
jgi:DNA-binding protein